MVTCPGPRRTRSVSFRPGMRSGSRTGTTDWGSIGRSAVVRRNSLERSAPADHLEQNGQDCDDQQHMNEAAHGRRRDEAERPER